MILNICTDDVSLTRLQSIMSAYNLINYLMLMHGTMSVSLQVQVLSETCDEDLRELPDVVEGVRLWSNRSRASLRLDVFSWDSEPES